MGSSGKWLKAPLLKKSGKTDEDKMGKKSKWKFWRSCSLEDLGSGNYKRIISDGSESTSVAVVFQDRHQDFKAVGKEWAAIRVQTAFRGFLARRELRFLKAVVRIQALFRGRLLRKQVVETLRRMQVVVRVQARIRA